MVERIDISAKQLTALADWLDTCVDCEEIHPMRRAGSGVTWASEKDGHTLRRRELIRRGHYSVANMLRDIATENDDKSSLDRILSGGKPRQSKLLEREGDNG